MWRPCATDEGRPSKYSDTIQYDALQPFSAEDLESTLQQSTVIVEFASSECSM